MRTMGTGDTQRINVSVEGQNWGSTEALNSKTHIEEDLPEVLGEGRPDKYWVEMAYNCGDGCAVRNF